MELVARAEPVLVTRARRRVAEHATRCGASDDQSLVIELLTSEIVTNAVVHAVEGGEIRIQAGDSDGTFTVSVRDESASPPEVRHPRPSDPHGRGLQVVERLAASWGVLAEPAGKSVWFSVELDTAEPSPPARSAAAPHHSRDRRTDGLLNYVPRPRCP